MASPSFDTRAVGQKLRAARKASGYTQAYSAKAIAVSRTTFVAIENGSRRPRPEELIGLAELYGITVNALLRPDGAVPEFGVQFRQSGAQSDAARSTSQLLFKLSSDYADLERFLGIIPRRNYPAEWRLTDGSLEHQAHDLAHNIRHLLGVGPAAPIDRLPELLHTELGINVFARPLPSTISGAFAYHPDVGACVVVNIKHPRARQRLTIAHELAHFFTRRHCPEVVGVHHPLDDPHERLANYFAYEFLMPASGVRTRFYADRQRGKGFSTRQLIFMAHSYGVSPEAMTRRLEDLVPEVAEGMYAMLRERGILNQNVVEEVTGTAKAYSPSRFALLVAEAYAGGAISEGQAARMLGLDRAHTRELLDALCSEGDESDD